MTIPLAWRSVSGLLGKDNDGLYWTGGWWGRNLALFQSDGTIQRKINVPFDGIRDMFQQPGENIVWLGSTTLASYNKSTGQWEQWPSGPGYYEGFAMAPKLTTEPILWMYPIGKAIFYGFNLKEKKIAYQIPTEKVPSNLFRCSNVECLYVDFDSNIWIGGKEGVSVVFCNQKEKDKWGKLSVGYINNARIKSNPLIIGTWDMPDGSIAEWMNDEQEYAYVALSKHSKAWFEGTLIDGSIISGKRTFIDTENGARLISDITYFLNENGLWEEKIKGHANTSVLIKHNIDKSRVVVCRGKNFDPATDISGTWDLWVGYNSYYFQDDDFLAIVSPNHLLRMKKSGKETWKGYQVRAYGGCMTKMEVKLSVIKNDSIFVEWKALDSNCDLQKGQQGTDVLRRFKAMSDNDSVFITEFRIFDEFQPVVPAHYGAKELVIDHSQNFISFDFASSSDPKTTTFYYQLEGFDKGWFMARMQRSATYTNLDGGSYVFRVRATDSEGNELLGNAQFRLRVMPPFYKTWWFIGITAILFFGLVRLFFQYRLRQRLEKEAIRLRIARDLHDEIGSTLSSISILSASALHGVQKDLDNARFGNIGNKARAALDSISDIVWSVNPENDSMEKALARMSAYASEMLENVGAELHFEVGSGVESLSLPMEKRKDFYLIFKEAIHNCAKYARAKEVWVAVKKEDNTLVFSIKDDGVGFEMGNTEPGARNLGGNGLRNMRSRAAALGGGLDLISAPGLGTEIRLKLPL
ncbi:MAG: hypothetical protein H7246_10830 [Phycisphaerae bacterium]|nr:hypothetical protein [Saprospiraceae bacterium]